ncbi:hypothetical protein QR680_010702 [Steinernema hermaphroditum]|uniref:SCP domain-containing protein n=1 Tax=Steinernema hermaphroditum TaxID=289476 RepID=A0AA39MBM8_9BILA|nr:hypothetical protein QR680_010702 [Steinernema hermaphroditum]
MFLLIVWLACAKAASEPPLSKVSISKPPTIFDLDKKLHPNESIIQVQEDFEELPSAEKTEGFDFEDANRTLESAGRIDDDKNRQAPAFAVSEPSLLAFLRANFTSLSNSRTDEQFWTYEYAAHCAAYTQDQYFRFVKLAYFDPQVQKVLTQLERVMKAWKQPFNIGTLVKTVAKNKSMIWQCREDNGRSSLYQMIFCLDGNLKYQNCFSEHSIKCDYPENVYFGSQKLLRPRHSR